jgi:tetratricopeptide (TPR) repeat protein
VDEVGEENSTALATVEMARAISLVTLGRYDEAMTMFDLAVEHDPSLGRAWFFRGQALNGLGRFDEALACLDRVVALDPRDANAWVEKGRALTRVARRDEALASFDRAIAINPWHVAALYEKGACLLFLGQYEAAAACLDEVAALRPGPAVEAARQGCQAGRDGGNGSGNAGMSSVEIHEGWRDVGLSDDRADDALPRVPPTFVPPPAGDAGATDLGIDT